MPAAPLDFTDGDTFKRFTIQNGDVIPSSVINCGTQRATVAEVDDQGWSFHPTIVSVGTGTFDVNVAALVLGEPPINGEGPNETVSLVYGIEGRYQY